MLNTINSDLIRGNIDTIILKSLFEGDRYGYDIIKEIEQKSNGQYRLKQPTLYSCLKRLEAQSFIRSYWGAKTGGGRRKYYTLTELGRELFERSQSEWEYSRTVIDKLISDKEYILDESYLHNSDGDESDGSDIDGAFFVDPSDGAHSVPDGSFEQDNGGAFEQEYPDTFESEGSETYIFSEQLKAQAVFSPTDVDNRGVQDDGIKSDFATSLIGLLSQSNEDAVSQEASDYYNGAADAGNEVFFRDSSVLFKELMNDAFEEKSYTDKLYSEKYEARPAQSSSRIGNQGSYFQDFEDEEGDAEDSKPFYPYPENTQEPAEAYKQAEEKPKFDGFMKYQTSGYEQPKNDDGRILEREYKGLLGKLLAGQSLELEKALMAVKSDVKLPKVEDEPPQSPVVIARSNELTKNLIRIADTARDTTGDNLKARVHDNRTDAIFRKRFHYYSNKLMLAHYAILFLFMLAMTVATFVTAYYYFKVLGDYDIFVYVAGVLIALAFPVIAAILNFINSEKKKRCDFDFKSTFVFKLVVGAFFILITYCINVLLGMPYTLDPLYTAILMLPALYAVCFPLSTIIFYALYVSGKYNIR